MLFLWIETCPSKYLKHRTNIMLGWMKPFQLSLTSSLHESQKHLEGYVCERVATNSLGKTFLEFQPPVILHNNINKWNFICSAPSLKQGSFSGAESKKNYEEMHISLEDFLFLWSLFFHSCCWCIKFQL